jgi:cell fate (sporulation/competence/biofilm development) regulator YmcA (YheA/YmcA/DUF963 family)
MECFIDFADTNKSDNLTSAIVLTDGIEAFQATTKRQSYHSIIISWMREMMKHYQEELPMKMMCWLRHLGLVQVLSMVWR